MEGGSGMGGGELAGVRARGGQVTERDAGETREDRNLSVHVHGTMGSKFTHKDSRVVHAHWVMVSKRSAWRGGEGRELQ